jgi:hypothetical protein
LIRHAESCRECKDNVARLLERLYGRVLRQYSLGMAKRLEDYKDAECFEILALIYESLQNHRGYRSFVGRGRALSAVDYFLPGPRMVVEFDEPQHFTRPRCVSLSLYPADLRLGYDRERWMTLAIELDRHDNDARYPYRDEQRAWYDTLRDFSSVVLGNAPTVRLNARDEQWCLLDSDRSEDVDLFRSLYLKDVESG